MCATSQHSPKPPKPSCLAYVLYFSLSVHCRRLKFLCNKKMHTSPSLCLPNNGFLMLRFSRDNSYIVLYCNNSSWLHNVILELVTVTKCKLLSVFILVLNGAVQLNLLVSCTDGSPQHSPQISWTDWTAAALSIVNADT